MPIRTSAAHAIVMAAVAVAVVAPPEAAARNRAPRTSASHAVDAPPGLTAIPEADLRRDMEALAGDAMRGREAGTLDELRASAWLAERARAAGLEPAGEDGTYFQFWLMRHAVMSPASRASHGGTSLDLNTEAVVSPPVDATINAPILALAPGTTPDVSAPGPDEDQVAKVPLARASGARFREHIPRTRVTKFSLVFSTVRRAAPCSVHSAGRPA